MGSVKLCAEVGGIGQTVMGGCNLSKFIQHCTGLVKVSVRVGRLGQRLETRKDWSEFCIYRNYPRLVGMKTKLNWIFVYNSEYPGLMMLVLIRNEGVVSVTTQLGKSFCW